MGLPWGLLPMGTLLGIPSACASTVGNIKGSVFLSPRSLFVWSTDMGTWFCFKEKFNIFLNNYFNTYFV